MGKVGFGFANLGQDMDELLKHPQLYGINQENDVAGSPQKTKCSDRRKISRARKRDFRAKGVEGAEVTS